MLARLYNEIGLLFHQIVKKEGQFRQIDNDLVSAVKREIEVFDKYYNLMAQYDLYYVATVLDPRIKTK
jgi:hypothetical protein